MAEIALLALTLEALSSRFSLPASNLCAGLFIYRASTFQKLSKDFLVTNLRKIQKGVLNQLN